MDFPVPQVPPSFLSTLGVYSAVNDLRLLSSSSIATVQSLTWPVNTAYYVPVTIPFAMPVRRFWWVNGSTITSSHADFGIYTMGGGLIASAGSTVQSGATAVQYVTPGSDLLLNPGSYYFAWACDNTTNRGYGTTTWTVINLRMAGLLQQAVFPLPTSMSPAAVATALAPLCGVTRTASGF